MSLVGTRPPTVDEWDKYELHHRARLATKPGLNTLHSYTFEGSAGFEKMQNIMASFRKSITEFAGKKVLII